MKMRLQNRNRARFQTASTALLTLLITNAYAIGLRTPDQDAEAVGRGNAFVATANNPSAVYYNPAGITQLAGDNIQIGLLNYFGIKSTYRSFTGTKSETKFENLDVPQLYYASTSELPGDRAYSFGLGIYTPFGLQLEWPEDSGFRTLALEARLIYVTLNPVLAYKPFETLSVAMGPTFNYSKVNLRQGIGVPSSLGGVANDEFRYEGSDWDFGYTAGILFQPHVKWSFGANYRSATALNYRGTSELRPYAPERGTRLDVAFPQNASAGVSFRPTPKWNLEAAVDWTDWNSVDTLTFENAPNPFTGQDIQMPLRWHSSWFYHVGVSRYFGTSFFASLGYFFSENSTSERHFTPIVPDTDLHVGSIGLGYKGKNWTWAVAGQLIGGPWRRIEDPQNEAASGKYKFFIPTVSLSVGFKY